MKKTITILVIILISIFYACKKDNKTTELTPTTPVTPTCTTCPYCVIDTAVVDTMPHMIATIDDTITFVASELKDTIIDLSNDEYIIGKNTFVQDLPEITLFFHRTFGTNSPWSYQIGDTLTNIYMTYKTNNITFHSKKGIIFDRMHIIKQAPPTYYHYMSNYASNFCFNTDTISGVSHKITLGSFRVKHP